jgi:hypothetical protein
MFTGKFEPLESDAYAVHHIMKISTKMCRLNNLKSNKILFFFLVIDETMTNICVSTSLHPMT